MVMSNTLEDHSSLKQKNPLFRLRNENKDCERNLAVRDSLEIAFFALLSVILMSGKRTSILKFCKNKCLR